MIFTKNVRNQVNKNLNSNELTKNQSKLCLKPLNIRFENNYKLFFHDLFDTIGGYRKENNLRGCLNSLSQIVQCSHFI